MPQAKVTKELNKAALVTKAFFRAADIFELARKDISDILGVSLPTIHRMVTTSNPTPFGKKESEIALMFLRIFRSLDALFGGNEDHMRSWFTAKNNYLNGIPKDLVRNIGGLNNVAEYLDAMRGKV